jgi:DinB superfamily
MDVAGLLLELYGRVPPLARHAVDGLDLESLIEPPTPGSNPVAWLVWHLARVQDSHIAELVDDDQIWETGDWAAQFGLEPDPMNTGYGHTPGEVATVRPQSPQALLAYLDSVDARTRTMLESLSPGDLDRVVDRRWDPPVTLGVRLVSVADDCLQHAGQAAYAKGQVQRQGR